MIKRNDSNGIFILLSLFMFLWYTNIIEPFYEIRFIIPILGLCMFSSVLIDFRNNYQKTYSKMSSSMKMQLIFYILMLPWGLLGSSNSMVHISKWIDIVEYLLIMIVIVYYSLSRGNMRPILWNISAIAIVLCVLLIVHPVDLGGNLGRYSLTVGTNPNGLAVLLSVGIWSILCLVSINSLSKPLGMIALGMILYAIFLTGSRKGLIGSLIMIIGWFFLCALSNGEKGNKQTNRIFSILVIMVAILAMIMVLIPYYNNSSLSARMGTITDEVSSGSRSRLYDLGIEDFANNFLFGYGFGGFALLHGIYSHSTILEVLTSCGLPMSIFYFLSYFVLAKEFLQKRKVFRVYNENNILSSEMIGITKMGIILLVVTCFYATCIIHIYEMTSMIIFGLLFSSSSYLSIEEATLFQGEKQEMTFSKYIR